MKWTKRTPIKTPKKTDSIVEKIAKIRGIDDVNEWVNPSSSHVHSPYRLDNIDKAVELIINSIYKELKTQIVVDIDTDGVCSTAIMYNYLKELNPNVTYIHAQREDGHGVETVLDKIEEDTKLLIIVDSSSNSVDACKKIKEEMGIDIVIIDHHEVDVNNEYAILVNCQLGDYPNKNLSGSAMVYKVCKVLDEYLSLELADDFLDLTAVGLIGDMMDVRDMENRYLIYNGINAIRNLGLQEILKQSNIDYSNGITSTNISFKVAPIIGACSRFNKIELALELLTTDDEDRAKELVKMMINMNETRKQEQKESVNNILEDVDDSDNIIIIVDNKIGSGFRGLVATEVVERYKKPVFIVSEQVSKKGYKYYTGSARSIGMIPLKEMCEESNLFTFATGHSKAHGVGFMDFNKQKIIDYFNKNLSEDDLQDVIEYDLEVDINDIDEIDIKQIEGFSRIVGQGFPEPTFRIKGIIVEEDHNKKLGNHVRAVMGKNKDTVKINCEDDLKLMRFRTSEDYARDIEEHYNDNFVTELEVVGSLNLNVFYNWGTRKTEITRQIFVNDYKIVS